MKHKKLTLIELIITILVLGLLVGLAVPQFIGVKADADVASFINDIDTLSKAMDESYIKDDSLPLGEKITLTDSELLEIIYATGDSGTNLYKIDLTKSGKYHSKLKSKVDADSYFIYSMETGKVFYSKPVIDGDGQTLYTMEYIGLAKIKIGTEPFVSGMSIPVIEPTQTITGEVPASSTVEILVNGTNVPVTLTDITPIVYEGKTNLLAGVKMKSFTSEISLLEGQNTVTVKVDSQVTNFKINLGTGGSTPVEPEVPVIKPVAVISMTPEQWITKSTNIIWGYEKSTTETGRSITNTEWIGKETNYLVDGDYTVKLRVQDSTGVWSDWTEKTFHVYASALEFWISSTADNGSSVIPIDGGIQITTSTGELHTGGHILSKDSFATSSKVVLEYDWTVGNTSYTAINHYVGATPINPVPEMYYGSLFSKGLFFTFRGGIGDSSQSNVVNGSLSNGFNKSITLGSTIHMKVVYDAPANTMYLYMDDVLISTGYYDFSSLGSEYKIALGKGVYENNTVDIFKNITVARIN